MKQGLSTKLEGYQHVIKKSETNGFFLTEAIYPPGLRQLRHTHESPHISFIFQGSYTERHRRRLWNRKTSSLVFHPFGLTHSLDFDNTETRIFTIEVKPRWIDYVCESPAILNRLEHFSGGLPVCLAARLFGEYRRGDLASSLTMEGLVLEMIAATATDCAGGLTSKNSRWLDHARAFIHAGFAENMAIEDIAKTAGVHPAHLARAFRKQTGYTIGEYVRRLRVDFASHQLASTDMPLREIAAAAGFSDQSHFSRIFKNSLRITPGEYRKIIRSR